MTKTRPSYTTEFKQEAASLVLDKDYAITEACKAMGVGNTAMRRWVKQLNTERGGVTPTAKAMTADQQKIQALKATIKKIEWEKEILKKATALLMSDSII
jgi:transposase